MSDFHLVSVMMPVYNGEKTLPLAISSLLNQTYTHWICIIVNDGSTDGTKQYLESLTDPRFKIIHFEKNKGRPYARQAALDAAVGDYIAFLDADDFYHPHKIEEQVKTFLQNEEISLVGCGMGSYDEKLVLRSIRCDYNTPVLEYTINKEFLPARAAAMIRLPKAKKIKYNLMLKYAQDTDYFIRYLDKDKYLNIDSVLYYYSEFQSVTKGKILKTKFYGFYRHISFFRVNPVLSSYRTILNFIKISGFLILYPFVKNEQLLINRGKQPSLDQIQEFKSILDKL